MAEDFVEIGLDNSAFLTALAATNDGLGKLGDSIEQTFTSMEKFNKNSQGLVDTTHELRSLSEQGKELVTVAKGFDTISQKIKPAREELKAYNEEVKKAAQARFDKTAEGKELIRKKDDEEVARAQRLIAEVQAKGEKKAAEKFKRDVLDRKIAAQSADLGVPTAQQKAAAEAQEKILRAKEAQSRKDFPRGDTEKIQEKQDRELEKALAQTASLQKKYKDQEIAENEKAVKKKENQDALSRKTVAAQLAAEKAPDIQRKSGQAAADAKLIEDAKARAQVLGDISKKQADDELQQLSTTATRKKILYKEEADSQKQLRATAIQKELQGSATAGGNVLREAFPAPSTATVAQLKAYESAIASVQKQLASGKLSAQQFVQSVATLKGDKTAELPGVPGASQLRTVAAAFDEVGKKGKDAGEEITISWEGALRLFQALILRDIGRQIIGGLSEAVQGAVKFNEEMLRVQAAVVGTGADVDKLRSGFDALSGTFNITRDQVAKIGLEEFGSKLKDADSSTRIMAEGFRLAKITGADNAATVTLLNETLKTYKLSADSAQIVSAKFSLAIGEGGLNAKQFESGFEKLSQTTKGAGVSFDETLGSLVQLGQSGLKTSDAMQSLESIINKIKTPSTDLKLVYRDLGVTADSIIPTFGGLQGALLKINEAIETGQYEDLKEEFSAIRGFDDLISPKAIEGLKEFNGLLEKSVDRLKEQNDAIQNSKLTQAQQFKQRASNAAEKAAEGLATFGNVVGDIGAKGIKNAVADPIHDVFKTIFGQNEQERQSDQIEKRIQELREKNTQNFQARPTTTKTDGDENEDKIGALHDRLTQLAELSKALTDFEQKIIGSDKKIQGSLEKEFGAFSDKIKLESKSAETAAKDMERIIQDSEKRVTDLKVKQETKSFERSIANLTPGEQAAATRERADQLTGEATKSFKAGNLEEARKKFDEVERLQDRVYQHEAQFRKDAEKLGVKFSTPIDDSKEQETTKTRISLEQGLQDQQKTAYQELLAVHTKIRDVAQQRLDIEKQLGPLVAQQASSLGAAAGAAAGAGAAGAAGAQTQEWGGYIRQHFAEGGPVGTDTIPAWLSPGEFVLNAESTQKFFPQLVLMNQGVHPWNNQTSDHRTTNVGDINIHMAPTDSTQHAVRQIARQIHRELRRGTVRIDTHEDRRR